MMPQSKITAGTILRSAFIDDLSSWRKTCESAKAEGWDENTVLAILYLTLPAFLVMILLISAITSWLVEFIRSL